MTKLILNPEIKQPDNVNVEEFLSNKPYSSIVVGSKRFFEALESVVAKTDDEKVVGCLFSDSVINVFLSKKEANN